MIIGTGSIHDTTAKALINAPSYNLRQAEADARRAEARQRRRRTDGQPVRAVSLASAENDATTTGRYATAAQRCYGYMLPAPSAAAAAAAATTSRTKWHTKLCRLSRP